MSKGGGNRMRAFVVAMHDEDAASITDRINSNGGVALNATMEGGRSDDVKANLRHEMAVLLDPEKRFTHFVMGPECELLEHAVALACAAGNLKLEFGNAERALPGWTRVSRPPLEVMQ